MTEHVTRAAVLAIIERKNELERVVPIYRVADLGWNPETGRRENADVNRLQGAPAQTGTFATARKGKRAQVIDWDPALKMVYVFVPIDYQGQDVRLHPHAMKPRLTVLTLAVDDLDRALRFYRDGLGFATPGIFGTEFEHGAVVNLAVAELDGATQHQD